MAAIVTTPPDDREELRLALALNGGLSLAIWIGGVSMEINRLIRGESVYGELLELTQSTARVDVMAGASAGGINGALLGMAIAHDQSLERVRKVWLDEGGMTALFRSPFQSDPPSLFRGDEYFLERLRKIFGEFVTTKPTSTEEYPIDLIMTTTMLRGERLDFDDEFGNTVHDVIHRGQFRFKRQGDRDDFRSKADAERLALAARSTASFPGAFEASFIPVGERIDGPERPDMKPVANFTTSRYVIDGGVLVNKPIGPVLRTIFSLPAEQQVRRVLAYVVPDPGMPPRARPQRPDQPPAMAETLVAGVTLPRVESIGLDLEELRDHNRRVRGQQRLRDVLLWERVEGKVKLLALADRLFLPYRDSRLENTVEYMLAQLTVGTRVLDAEDGVTAHGWSRADLRRGLRRAVGARIPRGFPGRQVALAQWPWDVKTVEGVAGIVMSVLKEALEVSVPDADPSWAGIRTELRERRREMADQITRLRRIRDRDIGYWKAQAPEFGAVTGEDIGPQAARSVDGWFGVLSELPDIPEVAARVLVRAGPALWAVATRAKTYAPRARAQLVAELEGLGVPMNGDEATAGGVLRLLLALAVIQQALSAGQPVLEQPVSLIQVSADTPNGFDTRERAEEKLAGIQLGHFGAFYKRSWRANDWMWGRLDGAWRLAQVALSPERLWKLALATGKEGPQRLAIVADAIEAIALGPDPAAHPVLRPRWNREAVEEELRFVAQDAPEADDVPASLPECAAAVARRIQLEVVTDELKHLADAITVDAEAGAASSPTSEALARDVRAAEDAATANGRPSMDPGDAVRLFLQAEVGRERISDEVGSDLFTATASTAAAVTVSAAQGKRSGLGGFRVVLSALRGLVLGLYVLAKSAMTKRRTGLAVMLTLLAAGGAVVAFAILDEGTSAWLVWAGLGVLLAGLALATARAGPWWVFGLMAATVLLALSPWIVLETVALSDAARTRLGDAAPVIAVIVAVLGSMLLGMVRAGALAWLPRDSRLAGQIVGAGALAILIAVAAALRWPAAIIAAAAVALGALVGWSLRDLTWRGAIAWMAAAPGRLAAWARSEGVERLGRRAGALANVLAAAGALGALLVVLLLAGAGPLVVGAVFGVLGAAAGVILRLLRGSRDAWVAAQPVAGGADTNFTLRWAPDGAPDGHVYDVVVLAPGEERFTPWRSDRRDGSTTFRLADLPGGGPGTYAFRARRRRVLSGRHWGWSRPARITIERTPARGGVDRPPAS